MEIQERRKKSTIWLFFIVDINDKTKAVYKVCREKVSRGGSVPKTFNTSNLRKHLKAHPEKYKELIEREKEKDESQSSKNTDTQKQVTLEALIEKRKLYSIDHPRAKAILFRIAEMIAVDLQPFSVVEDPGFCRLMKELEPRYSLPSRRYFSDVIIPSIHVNVNHLVTQLLSSTNFVSLTTDIWSSDNSHHSFMSLVAHFIIDSTMEKKDLMLSCWKFDESHTAENISSNILSHIQSWDIEETLVCVVRDNAANMITGMRVANIPSLSCLALTSVDYQRWNFSTTLCSTAVNFS